MTEREAIGNLKIAVIQYHDTFDTAINRDFEMDKALDLAIAALEKQIPRIPLDFECPRCHIDAAEEIFDEAFETYINKYDYFCQNCGQKLDWSEEE